MSEHKQVTVDERGWQGPDGMPRRTVDGLKKELGIVYRHLDDCSARAEAAEAHARALAGVIEQVEFHKVITDPGMEKSEVECLWCGGSVDSSYDDDVKPDHKADCPRQLALEAYREHRRS